MIQRGICSCYHHLNSLFNGSDHHMRTKESRFLNHWAKMLLQPLKNTSFCFPFSNGFHPTGCNNQPKRHNAAKIVTLSFGISKIDLFSVLPCWVPQRYSCHRGGCVSLYTTCKWLMSANDNTPPCNINAKHTCLGLNPGSTHISQYLPLSKKLHTQSFQQKR